MPKSYRRLYKKQKAWRYCLGAGCRGEKKFRSQGIYERICPNCVNQIKRLEQDEQED